MSAIRQKAAIFWVWYGTMLMLMACTIATSVGGCDEEQWIAADRIVTDANAWADTGRQVLSSPAGQTLPPDLRLYGALATSLIMSGAAGYKNWRLSQMKKTTKAIVLAIETADKEPTVNPSSSIKYAIGKEMRKAGMYDAGKKIVDRLKAGF